MLLEESALLIVKGLDIEFSRILELKPDGNFILRAEYDWKDGAIDRVIIKEKSQAECTLVLRKMIALENIENETHLECSEFLSQYGIVSGVTVLSEAMSECNWMLKKLFLGWTRQFLWE